MAHKLVIEKVNEAELTSAVRDQICSGKSVTVEDILVRFKNLHIVTDTEEIKKVLRKLVNAGSIEECGGGYLEPMNSWHDFA